MNDKLEGPLEAPITWNLPWLWGQNLRPY